VTSSSIYPLPHDTPGLWRLITENIPQSIRALRARRGFLKINCLLNAPPQSFTNLHWARRAASPKLRSLEWNIRDVAPKARRHLMVRRLLIDFVGEGRTNRYGTNSLDSALTSRFSKAAGSRCRAYNSRCQKSIVQAALSLATCVNRVSNKYARAEQTQKLKQQSFDIMVPAEKARIT
jgi:hypothetical protein